MGKSILDSSTQYSKFNESNNFEIDDFTEVSDYGLEDIPDIEEYQSLKNKKTVLTSSEQARLSELMVKLKDKILSVEKLNTILQSVAYMQKYFRDNTVNLVTTLKEDITVFCENKKTEISNYVTTCKTGILNYMKRLTVKDVYNASTTYFQCNIVTYSNNGSVDIYLCVNDNDGAGIKGISPTATAYWSKLSLKGDKGEPGSNLVWNGEWNSSTTYDISALVWFNGGMYVSKTDNNMGNIPIIEANDYWQFWEYVMPNGSVTKEQLNNSLTFEIDGKQLKHKTATLTLNTASWNEKTQVIEVLGVNTTNTIIVSPTPPNQDAYSEAGIICSNQDLDSLTFTCKETPSEDIVVNVIILEV